MKKYETRFIHFKTKISLIDVYKNKQKCSQNVNKFSF